MYKRFDLYNTGNDYPQYGWLKSKVYDQNITIGNYTYRAYPVNLEDIKNDKNLLNYSETLKNFDDSSGDFTEIYDRETTKFYSIYEGHVYFSRPAIYYLVENQDKLFPGYHIITINECENLIESFSVGTEFDDYNEEYFKYLIVSFNKLGFELPLEINIKYVPFAYSITYYGSEDGHNAIQWTFFTSNGDVNLSNIGGTYNKYNYSRIILCKNH